MGINGKTDPNAFVMEGKLDALAHLVHTQTAKQAGKTAKAGLKGKSATVKATPFFFRDPRLIPRREWLYGTHYIRRFMSMTIAPGGVGKSSLVIVEAIAMATGRRLLYHKPRKPLRVWIWNGEDPREEIERRIAAVCLRYDILPEEIGDRLFVDSGRDMEIKLATSDRKGTTIAEPVVEQVIATIRENKIDVLIVDPFVSSHSVSENDNGAIDMVAKKFATIAAQTGCSIELVHHVRKGPSIGSHETTADDARGASALVAAARVVRMVQRMTQDEADAIMNTQPWRYIRAVDGKANLAPPADKSEWFQLDSVELPNGTIDEAGDSVGTVIPWDYPASLTDEADTGLIRQVQEKVREGEGKYREDVRAAEWVGKHIASVLGLNFTDPRDKRKLQKRVQDMVESGVLVSVERLGPDRKRAKFIEVGEPQ